MIDTVFILRAIVELFPNGDIPGLMRHDILSAQLKVNYMTLYSPRSVVDAETRQGTQGFRSSKTAEWNKNRTFLDKLQVKKNVREAALRPVTG